MATKTSQYDKLKNLYNSELAQAAKDNPAQNLWDSLSYGYGKKAEEIGQNYDRAISQQDTSLLRRGMQRSSAGMQSLANLQNQKVKALGDNTDAMIADWQNRLQQQNEAQAARDFQANEAEKERTWKSGESALERAFTTSEREGAQAFTRGEREAAQAFTRGEREASQIYNTSERLGQQTFNAEQKALDRDFDREQLAAQQAFSAQQSALEMAFNREQFDYSKKSDDQKIAYNYVTSIIANGQDPTDDLLARAGLSRADANAMKAQAVGIAGGGSSYRPPKTDEKPTEEQTGQAGSTSNALDSYFSKETKANNIEAGGGTSKRYYITR